MSVENVKAFYTKVVGDKELQEKVKTLAQKERAAVDAVRAELISIANAEGYSFTADELAEAENESMEKLSPHELKEFAVSPIYKFVSCDHPAPAVGCEGASSPWGTNK